MMISSLKFQRGATLIVALVILLVMTMVGVASMRGATFQERMASNSRQQQLSRNAAEFALRSAERWLLNNVRSTDDFAQFNGTLGLYSALRMPGTVSVYPLAGAIDLTDSASWGGAVGVAVPGLSAASTSQDPRYIVEYIGSGSRFANSEQINELGNGNDSENNTPYFFRITAVGWSRDPNIYSVLESTFRTGTGSDFTY